MRRPLPAGLRQESHCFWQRPTFGEVNGGSGRFARLQGVNELAPRSQRSGRTRGAASKQQRRILAGEVCVSASVGDLMAYTLLHSAGRPGRC